MSKQSFKGTSPASLSRKSSGDMRLTRSVILGISALAILVVGALVTIALFQSDGNALPAAPDFELTVYQGEDVLGGSRLQLSDLQGRPLVLNFWAGLCPPCRAEMPDLQEVYNQYQDQVLLFGLDVGPFVGLGSNEDGRKLLRELDITYPTGTSADAQVVRDYGVLGMPTTVFITPDGKIHQTWTGLLTRDRMVSLVEELLQASL